MEFATIDGNFGVVTHSQNKKYLLHRSTGSSEEPTILTVIDVAAQKISYKYQVGYSDEVAITNHGFAAVIEKQLEFRDYDIIFCIDPNGGLSFQKKSYSFPGTLAFDNDSENLVVSFRGKEEWVECYAIIWFEVKHGFLAKAIQSPGLKGAFKIWFDENNSFQWS